MTITLDRPEAAVSADGPHADPAPSSGDIVPHSPVTVRRGRIAVAAGLSTFAAAWMTAHVFHDVSSAAMVGGIGCLVGAGSIYLAARLSSSTVAQYVALPVMLVVGAALTTLSASGGNLASLINATLHNGGLRNPPVPFDPGWRFLLVVLFGSVAAAATAIAISRARPKLAVGVPSVVTILTTLLQPKGHELPATVGAVVCLVAALGIAYGADLADQVGAGARFEVRRLVRGGVLLVIAVAALVGISQSSFLFPATSQNQVVPPRKPPASPVLPPDKPLFTVASSDPNALSTPWRLGVLDSYGADAWLLPSIDPARMQKVQGSTETLPAVSGAKTFTATVTITGLSGQVLPAPAGLVGIQQIFAAATYDPETDLAQLTDVDLAPSKSYTVQAIEPPSAVELRATDAVAPLALATYTSLPSPPPGVQALLAKAPVSPAFDRLQYVRSALLRKVVANGSGGATSITAEDVDSMLAGGSATPYQIVAAQVMLARWAGIPARIGFGFYGGAHQPGVVSFRPIDGSAWLEADFGTYGWVPIVGTPQKATPQLTQQKQKQSTATTSNQLALFLYLPVRKSSVHLVYEAVRYWAVRALGIGIPMMLLLVGYPIPLKSWRRMRRSRWARRIGPQARIAVAYADLRERCYDLNLGDPRATPLQFVASIAPDREHDELAWLVTRAVWGDLARDLRDDDVRAAEDMAQSVARRIQMEQPGLNRIVASVTRASLRDPWSDELPNTWRPRRSRRAAAGSRRGLLGRLRVRRAVTA
jgi:hypothetical protein